MKKIILSIWFVLVVFSGFSQQQKVNYLTTFDDKLIHFGFTLGLNTLDFAVVNYNPIGDNPRFHPQTWQLDNPQITYNTIVRSDVAEVIPGFVLNKQRKVEKRGFNGIVVGGLVVVNVPHINVIQQFSFAKR